MEPTLESPPRPARSFRLLAPLAFAAVGLLLVTSAVNAQGTDLRSERYADLTDLARQETRRVQDLQAQVAEVDAEIQALTASLDNAALSDLQADVAGLAAPSGLQAVRGPGVTVTLTDAPERFQEAAGEAVKDAIVHQQDIQAVANALWVGGAEAMTLQDQRVISTTGIKCVGNVVLLHGVTYSPPYRISAIGDPEALLDALQSSPYVLGYLDAVDAYGLGWEVREDRQLTMPAYEGTAEMRFAQAAATSS